MSEAEVTERTFDQVSRDNLTSRLNETPRAKCCPHCAFRRSDPQGLQASDEWDRIEFDLSMGLLKFYCSHTTDSAGCNQVCAGYHAIYGRNAISFAEDVS